jgi:hypothetical protein
MHIQSRGKYGGGGASGAHPHSTSRYLSPRWIFSVVLNFGA